MFVILSVQISNGQTSVTAGVTSAGYSLNTSAIAVDPGIVITSGSTINGFKVTISSGLKSSDVLSYTGSLPSGITVTAYNSSTGVITFNGTTSAANWQTFLRTVTYQNTNTAQYGDRTITFSAGSLSANSNGHFYEYVSTAGSWTTAKSSAAARTYLGYTGYLATITSASENAFIRQVLNADAWIGSSDERTQINTATGTTTYANQAAAEGNWYWVTGPEAGTMFSVGNNSPVTQSGQYANWNSGEPNNVGNEHYGEVYSSGSTPGAWNDLPNGVSLGYVVEYGGLVTDPVQNISSNTLIYTNISNNSATGAQVICNGSSASAITGATPYGGNGSYTYKWISSTTSSTSGFADASGTINTASYTPGSLTNTTWYKRVVTSGSLSDTSTAIMKTVNPALSSSASQTNVACNGATTGIASISVSGGTSGYTYSWSPSGGTAASATGLTAGAYTCLVTDANGCTLSRNYTITQPTALSASTSSTNVNCNGASNGTAAILMSGGSPSYSYSWSPSGGTSATATGLTAGAYTCVATDANGCTIARNYTITQPSALSISNSATNVSCNAGANGTAAVTPSGGTSPYTYAWSNGGTSASKTGLAAGAYTCTTTDANGCTSVATFTITQPTTMAATATSTNVSCNGGSNGQAVISVSGGTSSYSYAWSPSGGTSATATGLSAGTYTCVATDANGCTISQNYTITQPTVLAASSSATNVDCNGNANGTATVTPSGGTSGYTYSWFPSGQTTATATSLQGGSYTCTITDANGCTTVSSVQITEPGASLSINAGGSDVTCNGQATGLAATGVGGGTFPYTYLWSNGSTNGAVNGLMAGVYTCTVTDANGCSTQTSITINEPTAITVSASTTDPLCFGLTGSASVNATGGTGNISFSWTNGGSGAAVNNLAAGTYTVTATDDNFCTIDQTVTITEPAQISSTTAITSPLCNGGTGTATINVTGGTGAYTYLWSSGGTTDTEQNLNAGQYTVDVTDANGCTYTENVTVTEPTAISTTFSTVDPLCNGGTGNATIGVTGGTGNITYAWSTGGTTDTEINLAAGTYTVQVTDQNGCIENTSVTINEPAAITATGTATDENCNQLNGTLSITTGGGTGNLSYLWDNGNTTSALTGLSTGSYMVTVTDDNGCAESFTFAVGATAVPVAVSTAVGVTCNGDSNGSIDLQVTSGTGNYTYNWSNGMTTEDLQTLPGGTYLCTVTDAAGCFTIATVTVNEPSAINGTYTTTNEVAGNDGSIDLTVSGGTAGYTFMWDNGATTEDISGLPADDYTVIITDANGCTTSYTITVSSSVGLDPNANAIIVQVYPNPNTGVFFIKGLPAGQYRVVDAIGRSITQFVAQNSDQTILDLSHISNGLYFIHTADGSMNSIAKFSIMK